VLGTEVIKENMVNVCEHIVSAEYAMDACRARCEDTEYWSKRTHTHTHTHTVAQRDTCSESEHTRM
jgi:hypothetical protein